MKKLPKIALIVLLISLVIPQSAFVQQHKIRFGHLTFEEERWQGKVYDILQDELGFMWFGTREGLYKYDGYTLTAYLNDPDDPDSLSDNRIRAIHQDSSGVFWVGTLGGGLNRFVPEVERFFHYRYNSQDARSLASDDVRVIFEDRSGNLWIGTQGGGLNRLVLETEGEEQKVSFIRYQPDVNDPHSLSGYNITLIFEDQAGGLWIGTTDGGLNHFDRDTQKFTRYQHDENDPHSLGDNEVLAVFEDRKGILWVGTRRGGLARLNRETGQFTNYRHDAADVHSLGSPTDGVYTIYEDHMGTLWIGTLTGGINRFDREAEHFVRYSSTEGESIYTILEDQTGAVWMGGLQKGLYLYDRAADKFINYQPDDGDPDSLSYPLVWDIYEDRAGGLWFGTWGGIDTYHRIAAQFAHYVPEPESPHSLSHKDIQAVYQDHAGEVWVGTKEGLNRWDRETGQFFHYVHDDDDPHSLSGNYIVAIYEDQSGALWVGTLQHGLNVLNRETHQWRHYRHDPQDPHSLSYDYVKVLYEDSAGTLWVGTQKGLNRFDQNEEHFIRYEHDPEDLHSLSYDNVLAIYEDRLGTLWVGTYRGLNRFDPHASGKGAFTRYQATPGNPQGLSNDAILDIYEDSVGRFWLGTDGGGLHSFDRLTETFAHYRTGQGLPSDVVYGILEDQDGNLWLSTTKGLSKFNPQTETFENYDVDYGLQGNKFNARAFHKLKSGEMVFGGPDGLTVFDPAGIKPNPYPPAVVLTDFRVFNKSVSPSLEDEARLHQAISYADMIRLSYKDAVFSFEFAALSYALSEKNEYAYMLEGFDKEWNYIGTRRNAYFTNVPPGKYVFHVKGANNDGVWNETGTALNVTVVPPWWGTLWFRSFAVLLVFSIVIGGVWWRVGTIQQQNRRLEALVAERTQSLRAKNEELLRANVQLAQSEERFATVMNSMDALMYVADMETYEILFVNRYTRERFGDVEGNICWEALQDGQDGPCEFCTNKHLIVEGEPADVYTWEFQNTRTGHWYQLQDRAIPWLDGRLVRLEIATDITELKRAEQALQRSNDDLTAFAHTVSHDLQEPLRMVTSYLKLLERRYQGQLDADADDFIHFAVDGAERMRRLIKALLDYARVDTRGQAFAPTDCEAVLVSVLQSLHFKIDEAQAEITYASLPTVLGDAVQLEQLFQNLIANALKFQREGFVPQVHISAERSTSLAGNPGAEDSAQVWRFSVRDNGIGIPKEHQERIFGVFQRLHTRDEYEGTGIGLATCKKIVERHGGRIWVESDEGEGTTFYFTLPAAA